MRRVLVLGGTSWLGGEIVRHALARGAEVVCAARGDSGGVPAGATLVAIDRSRPEEYARLSGEWHEVVDVTRDPAFAESAARALAARARHWTFVSTVSVYARDDIPGEDESAQIVQPVDLEQYGQAKVAAERSFEAALGDRLLVVRPGLIAGPGDRSGRFGYWPARFALGGRVVTPEPEGRMVQVIDVRDLAEYIVAAGEAGLTGAVNAVGDPVPLDAVLGEAARAAGFRGEVVSRDDETLIAQGVQYWAGPHSLPLWLPPDYAGMMTRSNARYLQTGGRVRPIRQTIEATLADERVQGLTRERPAGLTQAEERALL